MKRVACTIATYVVGAYLTFGWVYHRSCNEGHSEVERQGCSAMKAMYWPAYWPGKAVIEGLRP